MIVGLHPEPGTIRLDGPGTPIDRNKLLGLQLKGNAIQARERVEEGKAHPETGLPFKATTDELNNTVTEHGKRGAGVSERQDVNLRPPTVVRKL